MQKIISIPILNSSRLSEYEDRINHLLANGWFVKTVATTKDGCVIILEQ